MQHTVRLAFTCKKTQGLFTCKKTHPSPKLLQNHSGKAGNCGESPQGAAVMGQSPDPALSLSIPRVFLRRIQAAALPGWNLIFSQP